MGFFIPFLMCAIFLLIWFALCRFLLTLYTVSVKRALWGSSSLDRNSAAALLSVYFGAKSLFRRRWFPKRSSFGTIYEEIPCILVLGRKVFVLEICPYPGNIHNTKDALWRIEPPKEYQKKEIQVQNPVLLARSRAETLKSLFGILKIPFEVSVESMAILTDQRHTLTNGAGEGLYKLSDAVAYLSGFAANSKPAQKKMKRERAVILGILEHYALSRGRALARNDRIRRQKK